MKRILVNVLNALLDRSAYVQIDYLYDYTGDERKKVLYTFDIYIKSFRKVKVLRKMPAEHAREVEHLLRGAEKPVQLRVGSEDYYETLLIPKWALVMLSDGIGRSM